MSNKSRHQGGMEASDVYAIDVQNDVDRGYWACLLDVTEPELIHALSLVRPGLYEVQRYLQWRPFIGRQVH